MHDQTRCAGRRDDDVGGSNGRGKRVEVARLGRVPCGQGASVLERSVQDPDGSHAAPSEVFHRKRGHRPRADHHDRPAGEVAEHVLGEHGGALHERVGRGPERRLPADPSPGPGRRVEQPLHPGSGRALAVGEAERLPDLRLDLRLAEHHRVQPAGHGEQVLDRVAFPVRVETVGQLRLGHPTGLREQPLERQEPRVVARDDAVDLDAVARGQDHGLLDSVHVLHPPVRLHQVVVGEREPLEQVDRCAPERDPEGEDGHDEESYPATVSNRRGSNGAGSNGGSCPRSWEASNCAVPAPRITPSEP